MSKRLGMLGACLLAAGTGWAQAPRSAPAGRGGLQLEQFRVDLQRRQVVVQAQVCLREGLLELLLCKAGTKDYESILRTPARPSDLHAALLALGLAPGLPVQWDRRDHQPVITPPRGPRLSVTLAWKDEQGQTHEAPGGNWLAPRGRQAAPPEWVFVGSQLLIGGLYQADMDGDVISVSNFASSVIDVPFQSTSANADLEFEARTEAIPPLGTPVEVTITPLEGAESSPYARAMVEVDAQGQLAVEGAPTSAEALGQWAREFARAHRQARVTIRAAGATAVQDVSQARRQLMEAGIAEVREEVVPAEPPWLLRTPLEARARLTWWKEHFARPAELVRNPGDQAQAELELVARRRAELARLDELLELYSRHLAEQIRLYRGSTQPAEGQ